VPRLREVFVCRSCGGVHGRWMGKCPDCGSWDSLEAHREAPGAAADPQRGDAAPWTGADAAPENAARPLSAIDGDAATRPRLEIGLAELDRALGGGLVPGSATLVGGPPGIGKSTLLLQAARALSARGTRVLYVSSEESAEQVRLRAQRLADTPGPPGGDADAHDRLFILAETNLARIVEQARRVSPAVLVIDSVQMIYKADLPASPGSVAQLRRCGTELVYLAKLAGVAVVLVGHVTKDGQLAGPRLLEHVVDAVLHFEGDRYHAHRIVRAVKNRFGSTLELGIFEMTGHGLRESPQGAGVLAPESGGEPRPGSVVCPVLGGSRCLLVEIQALTATGFLGAAKRKCSGLDPNRLAMIIAVLEQHAGMRLADRDVFASSVGGMRVAEPAADLALLLAIAGAHLRRALAPATAAVGEVGLGGEVRAVAQIDQRVREAARLGYRRLIVPAVGSEPRRGADHAERRAPTVPGAGDAVEVVRVRSIAGAIEQLG